MQQRPRAAGRSILERITDYDWVTYRQLFTPKLVTHLKGYSLDKLGNDAFAGLTVAILALPLSMAIAIGAGTTPDKGLITSVIAGLIISALGGCRFQIGGPAAAFIVIVNGLVVKHGMPGLMTATFIAGFILVIAGLLKLGTYIKYIPGPVIVGFTSGIGVIIALGQIKDFLGLAGDVPGEILHKLEVLWSIRGTFNLSAFAIGLFTLAIIVGLKRWRPTWPGLLIAVTAASAAVWLAHLPVETIGTRFGGIPTSLPAPHMPELAWGRVSELLPSAFTIAFLVGVESLLSAVAADTMAGTRHRSNVEIVAQGLANIASPLFGGLPATGVIARTGTNITAGAKTPVAGVLHAVFVLAFMLLAAPLAAYLALPCLAAVLVNVAWRLIDVPELKRFLVRAPWDDRLILLATLGLTVLVDLNVAIAVGVVLASMLFMHRMADTPGVRVGTGPVILDDVVDGSQPRSEIMVAPLPDGIHVFEFRGPLFFGVSTNVNRALEALDRWPSVVILRMREVPLIDSTGISALEELAALAERQKCRLIMSGLQQQPREALHRYGFLREHHVILTTNSFIALEKAKTLLEAAH